MGGIPPGLLLVKHCSLVTVLLIYDSLSFSYYLEIIRAKRLQVKDISSTSAELHWRPVLTDNGHYDIRFGPIPSGIVDAGNHEQGTDQSVNLGPYQRITRPGHSSSARLSNLHPGTRYNVTLIPQSNFDVYNTLHTTFTTQPGENSLGFICEVKCSLKCCHALNFIEIRDRLEI